MKLLLTLLLAALCLLAAPAGAQVIKSLGYNTTNGNVVYSGTNTLRFTQPVSLNGGPYLTSSGVFYGDTAGGGLDLEEGALKGITNELVLSWGANPEAVYFAKPLSFNDDPDVTTTTRTNLKLGLPALTNTSNVAMVRALAGSTNTNQPFSGSISLTNTNTLVFSNGILLSR